MTAELEARRTAAAAVVADFQREVDAWTRRRTGIEPDMATWAFRLRDHLRSLLEVPCDQMAGHEPAQLVAIRLLIESFDPEADDALGVLEQVDDVLSGDGR